MKKITIQKAYYVFILILCVLIFATGATAAGPSPVNLGTAGSFVILTKTGVTTTGTTTIVGDMGVSPIAATAMTGFGLIADSTNTFSTSSLVTGKIYAADYASPTPAKMTTAISDMETAFTDAAGRTLPDFTELGAGNISGLTLVPGLYKWSTGVLITSAGVTISGGANDVWIFQIAGILTVNNGAIVTLIGGAQAKNIFWQVSGQATLGTTADVKGIILSQTLISMNTGAMLHGRALAQTAVTLIANTITVTDTAPAGNLSIGNGTNPVSANAPQASTGNAMNGFSLSMSADSGTVNTLTLTGSAQFTSANASAIKIYRDNGTVGLLDGADVLVPTTTAWASNVATITFTTPEPVTTATGNYLVVVDVASGATSGNTLSGTITAATGTNIGTPAYGDSSSGTLTVSAPPTLLVVKSADKASAIPGDVITYSVIITNSGSGIATSVVVNDSLSPYVQGGLDSYGAGAAIQFVNGTLPSGLTLGTPVYSNNNGSTWVYTPSSGGGGAPAGYDGNITNWRMPMSGTMNANNANFTINYQVRVK